MSVHPSCPTHSVIWKQEQFSHWPLFSILFRLSEEKKTSSLIVRLSLFICSRFVLPQPISPRSSQDSFDSIPFIQCHFPVLVLTPNSSCESRVQENEWRPYRTCAVSLENNKQIPIKAFHAHRHLCYIICSNAFYFIFIFLSPCDGRWDEPKTKF